jgi:hypothetical protein
MTLFAFRIASAAYTSEREFEAQHGERLNSFLLLRRPLGCGMSQVLYFFVCSARVFF